MADIFKCGGRNTGKGPIYGVELITVLPMDSENPDEMLQAMPSRADLLGVKDYRQGLRVVAGYEVLLNHWREQREEIAHLKDVIKVMKKERR